jgi:hypothetical protein
MSDLCRPQRSRHRQGPRCAFALTRSVAQRVLPVIGMLLPAVVPVLTSLVLEVAAATCLPRKMISALGGR